MADALTDAAGAARQVGRAWAMGGIRRMQRLPDEWNVEFAGPAFVAGPEFDDHCISTLTVAVTVPGGTSYPVRTTGYLYAGSGAYLGSLDLRYFRARVLGPLHLDVRSHRIPGSASLLVAFQVGGGRHAARSAAPADYQRCGWRQPVKTVGRAFVIG